MKKKVLKIERDPILVGDPKSIFDKKKIKEVLIFSNEFF